MTNQVEVINEKKNWLNKATDWANSNYWNRMLGEALSAFVLIFTINFVISLGEIGIPVFHWIYRTNILSGVWIGFMTMVAFTWTQKTTMSANMINLLITKRNKQINKKEFWGSVVFQLIGGFFAGFLIYFFVAYLIEPSTWPPNAPHIMGGTQPGFKGLFLNEPLLFRDNTAQAYIVAMFQGLTCSIWIIIAFMLNFVVDKKTNNETQQWIFRYIILIVGISITTAFYANTTNPVRLLSPAIANAIMGRDYGLLLLSTTFTFILFQTIGMAFIYFELIFKEEERKKYGI